MGRNIKGIKAKGGGKWKYMTEQDMLSISAKFAPYRLVIEKPFLIESLIYEGVCSCGICGELRIPPPMLLGKLEWCG